jgi:hypothetical protein
MKMKNAVIQYCLKSLMILFIIFIPVLLYGDTTSTISADPFLICYLRNYPTLAVDISENVMVQRISYSDYDKKAIIYGDDIPGTERYTVFLFTNNIFQGIDQVTRYNTETKRYKSIEFLYRSDSSFLINQYVLGTDRVTQHSYEKDGTLIIANQGGRSGPVGSVIEIIENKYSYYGSYKSYQTRHNTPETTIELNGDEIIICSYDIISGDLYTRYYFRNGIKMEEYINGLTRTYTVKSGVGEILVTNSDGELKERWGLERKIDEKGYLVYESVRNANGGGYEYFFTKDTFR